MWNVATPVAGGNHHKQEPSGLCLLKVFGN